jgi:hypothetical protein
MPMPNEFLPLAEEIFERRSKGRTVINRAALLFFSGNDFIHTCNVRDVTNDGAGILLDGLSVLPCEFGLSLDGFRTIRKCRLVWREEDRVGATLES